MQLIGLFTILTHFWLSGPGLDRWAGLPKVPFSLFLSKIEIIQRVDIKQCYQYPFPIYLSPVKPYKLVFVAWI